MKTGVMAAGAAVLACGLMLGAGGPAGQGASCEVSCDAKAASAKLEPLKKLAGEWDVDVNADGKPDALVRYRVIAAGTAVVEEEFAGTDHEMMTVFTADGKGLVATHYCAMGNQPRMRCDEGMKDGVLSFSFVDGGNLVSRDQKHMDSLRMEFKGEDRVVSTWTTFENGKAAEGHAVFDMKRRGKPSASR